MKKRVVRITESQLDRITKRVIIEQGYSDFRGGDFRPLDNLKDVGKDLRTSFDFGDVDNKNQKPTFQPVTISGSYNVKNVTNNRCDQFHAFEKRSRMTDGVGMNDRINKKLKEIYVTGINPDIIGVNIEMDSKTWEVTWSVTIGESIDGNAWVGFTSRGSAGGTAYIRAEGGTPESAGQNFNSVRQKTRNYIGDQSGDLEIVKDYLYNLDKSGNKIDRSIGCPVRQIFYKYNAPIKYPPH